MDLHELAQISSEAWHGKAVGEGQAKGKDALLPVSSELADDVFDIALIDQVIPVHDRVGRGACHHTAQDLLLVPKWYLGIGDQYGREQRVGSAALLAADTLYNKGHKLRKVFYMALVMPMADQAAFFPTCALHHVELELSDRLVI